MGLRAEFRKHSYGKKAFNLAKGGNFRDALDLIDKGGNVNYRGCYMDKGRSIHWHDCNIGFIALDKNNMQALEKLFQRGLDPNSLLDNNPDNSLLRSAINRKNQQAVDLLVKAGARTDVTLENMKTLREFANENGIKLPAQQTSENLQPGPKL